MKKLILFLIFAAGISTVSFAKDFEKTQLNFKVRSADYGLEIREEIQAEKDHIQLSYFGIKNTEIRLRYVDNLDAKEWRPQISYFVYQGEHFFFRPRLDYRHFTGNSLDYFSFRTSVGSKFKLSERYSITTEVNPIWDFGIDKSYDKALDKVQFRLGIDYTLTNIQIMPFIQYETNGHFDHTDTFIGTTLTITL